MLKKLIGCTLLFSFALPFVAVASGTFIAFPPKPQPKVDCSLPENSDNDACK